MCERESVCERIREKERVCERVCERDRVWAYRVGRVSLLPQAGDLPREAGFRVQG